jgi:hypothetical protein
MSTVARRLGSAAGVALTAAALTVHPAGGAGGPAPVPAVLTATESGAEDIVDYALAGDRGSVVATAKTLRETANGPAAATLRANGVPAAVIRALEQRADRLARVAGGGSMISVAIAANAVSGLMPSLYARFHDRVPPTILRLDYLDREAQLRSLAHQPPKAVGAVAQLAPAWLGVRRRVIAAGGKHEAALFDHHVAAMKKLGPHTGRSFEAEAARGLELVDQLERVFTG